MLYNVLNAHVITLPAPIDALSPSRAIRHVAPFETTDWNLVVDPSRNFAILLKPPKPHTDTPHIELWLAIRDSLNIWSTLKPPT